MQQQLLKPIVQVMEVMAYGFGMFSLPSIGGTWLQWYEQGGTGALLQGRCIRLPHGTSSVGRCIIFLFSSLIYSPTVLSSARGVMSVRVRCFQQHLACDLQPAYVPRAGQHLEGHIGCRNATACVASIIPPWLYCAAVIYADTVCLVREHGNHLVAVVCILLPGL